MHRSIYTHAAAALVLLLLALPGHANECQTSQDPNWLFCDDFEMGTLGNWIDVVRLLPSVSTQNAHDGAGSARLDYAAGSTGAGWMWKKGLRSHSSARDSQYIRWWQKWEPGFQFQQGDGDQKLFMLYALDPVDEWGQTSNWKVYVHMADGGAASNELLVNRHIPATNDWKSIRQQSNHTSFETDRWYCIEVGVQHNTPGQADGALQVWIDEQPVIDRQDFLLREDATSWNAIQMNGWYAGSVPGNQSSWVDQVVVSSERIRCDGQTRPMPPEDVNVE